MWARQRDCSYSESFVYAQKHCNQGVKDKKKRKEKKEKIARAFLTSNDPHALLFGV